MKKIFGLISVFLCLIIFSGCEENILTEEFSNSPAGNYKAFCSEFSMIYGAFEAKHINWDSLTTFYGKDITERTTDKELFDILSRLLRELNDGHANIISTQFGQFMSSSKGYRSFFSDYNTQDVKYIIKQQDLIRGFYLGGNYTSAVTNTDWFFYGTINYKNKKIGYLYIPTFIADNWSDKFIDDAVGLFNSCDAVVVDVRFNGGGQIETFAHTVNMFSNERKCYLKSKFRNGPGHTDFTDFTENYTAPHANSLRNIPIAILTNCFSASGAELFLLGMKSQKNVFSVGDTTWGAFSQVYAKYLPNGWLFRAGSQVIYKPDGSLYTDSKGNYIEGIGIAPDIYCVDKLADVNKGHDSPLDKALEELLKKMP